ncbi:MAG: DUF2520 domain-containing protein [Bacteroidetes bacterium]|nr:DUF2520 domain-containing protein [Bacteroidota bacterium]
MALSSIDRLVFIGAGRIATHLAITFKKKGFQIVQVWSRSLETAARLANRINAASTSDLTSLNPDADIYIFAVPDHALPGLLNYIRLKEDQLLVHTSGSLPAQILMGHSENYGVFYPLQTFSPDRKIDFKNVPIVVEGNHTGSTNVLMFLAGQIAQQVHVMDSEKRKVIHLAAVFACNFPNYMYTIAQEILHSEGISFDLIRPLILETAGKVQKKNPDIVQTGPAVRDDKAVIEEHLLMLAGHPDFREIYEIITRNIVAHYK